MPQRLFRDVLASLIAYAENGDVLLILVLCIREVTSSKILTSLNQVPNVKILRFTYSQNLSERAKNGGSM